MVCSNLKRHIIAVIDTKPVFSTDAHLGLADKVRVGIVGGMTDIITAMWRGDSVIDQVSAPIR